MHLKGSTSTGVIKINDATDCCEAHGNWYEAQLRSILGDIANALLASGNQNSGLRLAFTTALEAGTVSGRVITIAETGALAPAIPGIVVLLTATELARTAGTTAALKTFNAIYQAIDLMIRETGFDCETCNRLKALGQTNPRKRVVEKLSKRIRK